MDAHVSRIQHGSSEYAAAVALRRRILRAPLGLTFTAEELDAEREHEHLAAFTGDALVGTLVLTPVDEGVLKLRQMAVAPEGARQGTGGLLVAFAERVALERGTRRIVLHARVSAQPFYEKQGYRADGAIFTEVTVPHIAMSKLL